MANTPEDINDDIELTPRQRRFVEEYPRDLNGTQAAIRAGYSAATAQEQSSRLLSHVIVRAAVDKALAYRQERTKVTADNVIHEMQLLANSSLEHYFVDDEGNVKPVPGAPEGCMRAIESIKKRTTIRVSGKEGSETITKTYDVTVKLWDKPSPLKLMGKHVGLFPDKVTLDAPGLEKALEKMTDDELATRAALLAAEAAEFASKKGEQ